MPIYIERSTQKAKAPHDVGGSVAGRRRELFDQWKQPPSKTEQERVEAVKKAIKRAIDAYEPLKAHPTRVDVHGSYATNTNVRQNSDVDVQIVFTLYFHNDYSGVDGLEPADVGFSPLEDYSMEQARPDVLAALRSHFGSDRVTDKAKAIHVAESPGHVEADVIACFMHRRYGGTKQNLRYNEGVRFKTRAGDMITNWPRQNQENGHRKAEATHRRFKKVVRIFKRLNIDMQEQGHAIAKRMSSYFLEGLVWNVPNNRFGGDHVDDDVRGAISYLFHAMDPSESDEWGEVNELTYLLKGKRTKQDVKDWTKAAWNHCGYANE